MEKSFAVGNIFISVVVFIGSVLGISIALSLLIPPRDDPPPGRGRPGRFRS